MTTLTTTSFGNSSHSFQEEKAIQRILIGKEEVKLFLFAHDIILYTENPRDVTRKLLEITNDHRVNV